MSAARGGLAASVLVDSATSAVGATFVNYGSILLINATGELNDGLSGRLDIGDNAASTVTVQSGGKITLATGTLGGNVRIQLKNGSTLNTAGGIDHNVLTLTGASTVNMSGGSITVRQAFNGVVVAGLSTFNQSGGTLTTSNIQINQSNYIVSGGTINATIGSNGLYFTGATAGAGSTFTVKGSAATINFSSYRNDDTGSVIKPTFAFELNNTANHISTINFAANGISGATLRTTANLQVSLAGGVLLSGANTFTVIQRQTGATDTAWSNSASLTGLWKDATVNTNSTTKADIKIGFNGAAAGTLDVAGLTPISFTPATLGYINLTNASGTMQLGLDITGGTLSNFTNALTGSGIGWTAGSGAYDVIITLNPSVSGGNYFAWDFTNIDGAMQLQGLSPVAPVPEPASYAILAGLGVLGFVSLRRRRRSQSWAPEGTS